MRASQRARSMMAATALLAVSCGASASEQSVTDTGAPVTNPALAGGGDEHNCPSDPPRIELTSGDGTIDATVVNFSRSSATCAISVDGNSGFDSQFGSPPPALHASDGWFAIVAPDGEVSIDLQFDPGPDVAVSASRPVEALTASEDGSYVVELPGDGCYLATIGLGTETESGTYIAEVETAPGTCVHAD